MLKLGEKIISDIYLGDKKIAKVFLGDKLVFNANKYTKLAYIESTGTQYIDTGVSANANTIVEYTFSFATTPQTGGLFGSGTSQTSIDRFQGYYETGLGFSTKLASTTTYANVTLTANTKYYSKMGIPLVGYYIDEKFVSSATGTPTDLNLYIFGRNIGGSFSNPMKMRLHSFKISENETLVRDFIPVLDKNNIACLYDKVTGKYFYNKGTGEFKAGDIISDEPIWLEYLESNGNQYIDLEYVMTNMLGVRSEVVEQVTLTGSFSSVFGYLGNKGEQNSHLRYGYSYYQGGFMFTFNMTPVQFNPYDREKHFAVMYSNENYEQYAFVNDIAQNLNGTTFTDEEVAENTLSMYLFGRNVNGAFGNGFIGKIYGFRHYDHTGTLVIDVRPCLHPVTLKPAMYDVVRKKYFYNKGIGEFTYEQTFTILDYIESDGNQHIDTGVVIRTNNYRKEITLSNVLAGAGSESPYAVMGSQTVAGGGARNPYLALNTQNKLSVGYAVTAGGSSPYTFNNPTTATTFVLERKENKFTFTNGTTTYNVDYTGDKDISGYSEWICALNIDYSKYSAKVRVYKYRLDVDNILTRDYIPVRMHSGEIGLYDFITGKLYENAGTGSFKGFIGNMQLLEYLESDGNQYIDTEIVMKTMKDVQIKLVSQSTYVDTVFRTHFGFMKSTTDVMPRFGISDYSGSRMFSFNSTSTGGVNVNTNKVSYLIKSDDKYIAGYIDGVEKIKPTIIDTGFADNTLPLWLFARNVAGALNTPYVGKINYFTYNDICEMIPAKLSDGRVGMYDFVRKKLYENQGTGTLGYIE